jgi:hypothetical protein
MSWFLDLFHDTAVDRALGAIAGGTMEAFGHPDLGPNSFDNVLGMLKNTPKAVDSLAKKAGSAVSQLEKAAGSIPILGPAIAAPLEAVKEGVNLLEKGAEIGEQVVEKVDPLLPQPKKPSAASAATAPVVAPPPASAPLLSQPTKNDSIEKWQAYLAQKLNRPVPRSEAFYLKEYETAPNEGFKQMARMQYEATLKRKGKFD